MFFGVELSPSSSLGRKEADDASGGSDDDDVPDDSSLLNLTVKDLNRRLQGLPKSEVAKMKRKRRTLKNRG